jgi:hypothetical protein
VARQRMSQLLATVRACTIEGAERILRTDQDVLNAELAPDYPIRKWLNDGLVSLDERRYLRSISTKAPFWEGLPDLKDRVTSSDFFFEGRRASGLGVASLLDALALSLASEPCWDAWQLALEQATLLDDGTIDQATVYVRHLSSESHARHHKNWIVGLLHFAVVDGNDLWRQCSNTLTMLDFCDDASRQICELSKEMLQSVQRHLVELDRYCQSWTDGPFDPDRLRGKPTTESEATLQQYAQERTFVCPDGQARLFNWHLRLTPNSWRLYFIPGTDARRMTIGYIGPHLRTVLYS